MLISNATASLKLGWVQFLLCVSFFSLFRPRVKEQNGTPGDDAIADALMQRLNRRSTGKVIILLVTTWDMGPGSEIQVGLVIAIPKVPSH